MLTQAEIIDALQWDTAFDTINTTPETPYQITYQYADSQPSDMSTQYTGWETWSAAEKANYKAALDHIETLINVEFVEVTGQSDPTMNVGKVDFPSGLGGLGGFGYSYSGTELRSLDNFTLFNNDINMANATNLILHEVGHALMNKHPFSGSPTLPDEFDTNKYTVMSYDRNPDNNQDSDAMMLFDVLALQDRWGANTSTETGNTTYTGSRTDNLDTIWDAGGTDTLDATGRTNDVRLDLREGMFSQFGSYDDVSIAYGTVIENARGGTGDDIIEGNSARNHLFGAAGDDVLSGGNGRDSLRGNGNSDELLGGGGKDLLRGGQGKDTLDGGKGDDRLRGDAGQDNFIFRADGGNDTVLDFQNNLDTLVIDVAGFDTFGDIRDAASFDGTNVTINFGSGDSITINDITLNFLENDTTFI